MDGPFAFLKTVFLESWEFSVDHLFLHFLFLPIMSHLEYHVILMNKWPYAFQWIDSPKGATTRLQFAWGS